MVTDLQNQLFCWHILFLFWRIHEECDKCTFLDISSKLCYVVKPAHDRLMVLKGYSTPKWLYPIIYLLLCHPRCIVPFSAKHNQRNLNYETKSWLLQDWNVFHFWSTNNAHLSIIKVIHRSIDISVIVSKRYIYNSNYSYFELT